MDFNKLSLGDRIIAGTGILLFLDLLIFPWHHYSSSITVGDIHVGGTFNRTALQSPDSFWGILAWILTIVVVAAVVVNRLTTVKMPELPVSHNIAIFIGTIAVAVCLFLKLISTTDFLGFGCWLGIILAAGMVYGGFLLFRAEQAPSGSADTIPPTTA